MLKNHKYIQSSKIYLDHLLIFTTLPKNFGRNDILFENSCKMNYRIKKETGLGIVLEITTLI